jgi:hypothetical protein
LWNDSSQHRDQRSLPGDFVELPSILLSWPEHQTAVYERLDDLTRMISLTVKQPPHVLQTCP